MTVQLSSRRAAASLTLGALLTVSACGGADEPLAQPLTPSPTNAAPSPSAASPAAEPSPSPAAPLSPFEGDPAVIALRTFLREAAVAVNAGDLSLPSLDAVSTEFRTAQTQRTLTEDLGGYVPGPFPLTPLGVEVVSETSRKIPYCTLESGWTLTAKGGPPREAQQVTGGGVASMVLSEGVWKVESLYYDESIDCAGVPLPMPVFA